MAESYTHEELARWALFGDPHAPRVYPIPMRELLNRVTKAIQDAVAQDRARRGDYDKLREALAAKFLADTMVQLKALREYNTASANVLSELLT